MSQTSFEGLADRYPEYRQAFKQLDAWLRSHRGVVDPRALVREIQGVDVGAVGAVLTVLVRAGLLKRVYKVVTPSGALADGEFENPQAIPEKLPDRLEHYFETAEADVVPIFKKIA
jgi:hypothetical protein